MCRYLVKINQQALGRAEKIGIGAQKCFNSRKTRPDRHVSAALAVQRHPVRGSVRIDHVAKRHRRAVGQADGAQLFHFRKVEPVEHRLEALAAEGLAQIVAGIHLIALAGKFIARRAENELDLSVRFPDLPRDVHAGEAFHENIQQDDVKAPRFPAGQKILAARKYGDPGGISQQIIQTIPQARPHLRVVIHNGDPQFHAPSSAAAFL